MDADAIIDEAERIGERDAGRHLQRTGRYPTDDDTDGSASEAWSAAWASLEADGADDDLYDAACEGWRAGYLGPRA